VRPPPRRRSGPRLAGAVAGGVVALPGRLLRAPARRVLGLRAGPLLDALLRGRGWIPLVAVLLVGIVFFNVDLLRLNRDIAHTADRAAHVRQQNARLRSELARIGSSEAIQEAAAKRGLVLPAPGEVRYVHVNPPIDALRAAKRPTDPDELASVPPGLQTAPAGSGQMAPATPTQQPQAAQPQSVPTQPAPVQQSPQPQPTPTAGSPTG
jgi:cell division protein FtsL